MSELAVLPLFGVVEIVNERVAQIPDPLRELRDGDLGAPEVEELDKVRFVLGAQFDGGGVYVREGGSDALGAVDAADHKEEGDERGPRDGDVAAAGGDCDQVEAIPGAESTA